MRPSQVPLVRDHLELKLVVYLQPVSVGIGLDADFYHWEPTSDGSVYYGPGNTTVSLASRRLLGTSRLVVVELTLSSSTHLLSFHRLRHMALGQAITKP